MLLDLHVLCTAATSPKRDPDGQLADLRLPCSDELQARCAGSIEAEIERHSDELAALREAEQADEEVEQSDAEEEEEDSDDGAVARKKKKTSKAAKAKKGKGAKKPQDDVPKKKSAGAIRGALTENRRSTPHPLTPSLVIHSRESQGASSSHRRAPLRACHLPIRPRHPQWQYRSTTLFGPSRPL